MRPSSSFPTLPRLLALAALLTGCAHHRLPSTAADLGCRGLPAPKTPAKPVVDAGAVSVTLISGEAPDWRFWELLEGSEQDDAAAAAWGIQSTTPSVSSEERVQQWYAQQAAYLRLSVQSEGALLGSLATRLSEATGLNVTVQANMVDLPVSIGLSNVSLAQLAEALAEGYGVRASFEEGILYLSDTDGFLARNFTPEPPPIETALVEVPEGVDPLEVAHAWCTAHASPRGTASVVDGQVLVRDRSTRVALARELVHQLEVAREEAAED